MTVLKSDGDIVGNADVIESLKNVATSPTLGHAYLLWGPDGVGKRQAALAFARAINCGCGDGSGTCEACRLMDQLNHPELLLLEDMNKPRWLRRADILRALQTESVPSLEGYTDLVGRLLEAGYLEEPLPRTDLESAVDGFHLVGDKLFGRGSVPSKECYTPTPVSEEIRRSLDGGHISPEEYTLLKELYEYPLSVMPYRGAIPIAYVASRKGWKFTRPIQAFLGMRTMLGGKKIVVIDDADKMTPEAQNCLLKTLEEPPADSVLILVTSDTRRLFQTIVSRCQVVSFRRLTNAEMETAAANLLGSGAAQSGLIASLAGNSPGRLLELSAVDIEAKIKMMGKFFTDVEKGHIESVFTLSQAIFQDAGTHRMKQRAALRQALELLIFWIVEALRAKHDGGSTDMTPESQRVLKTLTGRFDETSLLEASRHIEKGLSLLGLNVDMALLLQNTLLRTALTLRPAPSATRSP